MPLLARLYIKTALFYFAAALAMAAMIALQPVLGLSSDIAVFRPVYMHLLVVGWITQLIIGVVFWMFPKFSKERPRGSERLAWAVYFLLNVGLAIRAFAEPLHSLRPELQAGWLLVLSAILQFAAAWGFIANTWGRVKER